MPAEPLRVRRAAQADAAEVVPLVNGAYRDETGTGWTAEAHLVAGPRIDEAGFRELLARPGSVVLVGERESRIVATVHLSAREGGECFLGLLSVLVTEQAAGVGRAMLAEAEAFARRELGATLMAMHVLAERAELMAWYERRGYRRTGRRVPFLPRESVTLVRGPLEFERLEKPLA